MFGREEDIAFLDNAWANQDVNIVTIVAWAGVGKSTLVNHWLRRMATDHYRSAELVYGWSFYRHGTGGNTSSADEFVDAALRWLGDPDPRIGTAWQKGDRLANLIAHRRALLVLDGLEPLQYPPGSQEGRLRDPALQALLRELAAFNLGLCVITTRMPVADLADYERTAVLRRDLEQLSGDAGAKLLQALGVRGQEVELRSASRAFAGHSLALTLLDSYLADAYKGDIRRRAEVSMHLAQDVRQGVHARKVMESYQAWLGEGPELSVLRMLGLFDRPADELAIRALLRPPAILGLTESLVDLSPAEWQAILSRLRGARLLSGEDAENPEHLDTHPLVREYFGEQLHNDRVDAWRESNKRLFDHYRASAPRQPETFKEMEPLFRAVIYGCKAGLLRETLHEVFIPRIQRGKACFAANLLGARGALLSTLAGFFEHGRWQSPLKTQIQGQSLTAEDQLYILMQAAQNFTATRGSAAPEVRTCYASAQSLCHSLNRPLLLHLALMGEWRYSFLAQNITVTLQLAERLYSLAQQQNNAALMMEAYHALAATHSCMGNLEAGREYAIRAVQIWRSGSVQSSFEQLEPLHVKCLCYQALAEWHFGELTSCQATISEAIFQAKELNDTHAIAETLFFAAILGQLECHPAKVESIVYSLIELATRHNFAHWLAAAKVYWGWSRGALGQPAEAISSSRREYEIIGRSA